MERQYQKVRVENCDRGTIARFEGEWGVLEGNHFDRWHGGAVHLRNDDVVEILMPKPKRRKRNA